MKRRDRRESGFTLLEMVVAMLVVSILVAASWQYVYMKDIQRAEVAATAQRIKTIKDGIVRYVDENCFDFSCVTQPALGLGDPVYVPMEAWAHAWSGPMVLTTTATNFTIDVQSIGTKARDGLVGRYTGVAAGVVPYDTGVRLTFQ